MTQIRKAGLNVRRPLKHFFQYYKMCADDPSALKAGTVTKRTELLLKQLNINTNQARSRLAPQPNPNPNPNPNPPHDPNANPNQYPNPSPNPPLYTRQYRVGKTLLFLQNYDIMDMLDKIREEKILEYVIILQSFFRMLKDRPSPAPSPAPSPLHRVDAAAG